MGIDCLNQHLEAAAMEARKSPMRKKHGAVLLFRNRVVSRGYNRFSSLNGKHRQYCLLPG
ncbi:hypothetical protein DIPPA_26870 [Diplonema papillatum]|nr:hypothetical protein DIPPA_26870 [Diplonema papillatum]